jgi:hypothetical protein
MTQTTHKAWTSAAVVLVMAVFARFGLTEAPPILGVVDALTTLAQLVVPPALVGFATWMVPNRDKETEQERKRRLGLRGEGRFRRPAVDRRGLRGLAALRHGPRALQRSRYRRAAAPGDECLKRGLGRGAGGRQRPGRHRAG